MSMLSQPAFGPKAALVYITVGALMDVWTAVYYFLYFRKENFEDGGSRAFFWITGLFLTGLTLVVIGVLLGQIGQSARRAELPPADAENKEAAIQQTAAATPHPVAPAAMGAAVGGVGMVPGQMMPGAVMPPAVPAPPPGVAGVVPRQ